MRSTFPEEAKLKLESEQKYWNPRYNLTVETVHHCNDNKSVAMYICTKKLLIDHLKTESNVNYSKVQAALHVWIE